MHEVILNNIKVFEQKFTFFVECIWVDDNQQSMVDKHAFLNDEKLGSNSNFTNPWMSWDGYYSWKHHCHYFVEFGQVQRSSWGIVRLLMGMFWVWKWFCIPRLLHRHYCQVKENKSLYFIKCIMWHIELNSSSLFCQCCSCIETIL
jgi:hypothetical protein